MVKVAKIINTHALKGECKLYLYTDDAKNRFKKGSVFKTDDNRELKVKSFRMQKNLGYAFFEEIHDINEAEKYKNQNLWVDEKELPELEEDEYYYHQLQGCEVYNTLGEKLGTVSDILETGANIVLRVSEGKSSFLVPFVSAHVKEVDIQKKLIIIEEMAGLR